MTREDAMRKILSLLDLSDTNRNPSEEEAKSAALMAQKLMVKYDINIEDVKDGKPAEQELANEAANLPKNACPWKNNLAAVLAPNFRCVVYMSGGVIRFIGHKDDAVIAARTLEYLYTVGHKLALSYSVKHKGGYNSWVSGFVSGIKTAFEVQCTALVVVTPQEAKDALADMMSMGKWKGTKGNRESMRDAAAHADGYQNGKDMMGRRQIAAE